MEPVKAACRNATPILHHDASVIGSGCGELHGWLFRWLYPVLLFFCLLGNVYCLLVYRLKCFKV